MDEEDIKSVLEQIEVNFVPSDEGWFFLETFDYVSRDFVIKYILKQLNK